MKFRSALSMLPRDLSSLHRAAAAALHAARPEPASPALVHCDPSLWREHRFGLNSERWNALQGQWFWITGAGTGYGRAVASALGAAGANLVLSSRRQNLLEQTAQLSSDLAGRKVEARIFPLDLSDPQSIDAAAQKARAEQIPLAGVIHCAALLDTCLPSPLLEATVGYAERMLAVNIAGPWLFLRSCLPLMAERGRARVVLYTSEAGWSGAAGYGWYNITKSALNALGHSFASECSLHWPQADLQINTLSPGEAKTEMNPEALQSPFAAVSMTLLLLSQGQNGPHGRFFHRDGRHLSFGHSPAYPQPLQERNL